MLGVTKLLCETTKTEEGVGHKRHGHGSSPRLLQFVQEKRPVVVWNITKRCNLKCVHCYSNSTDREYPNELSTKEAVSVIDDLAGFKVPVIIFSGGEPLLREDVFTLALYARGKGIRCVLSSSGVLINKGMAKIIRETGFSYVGVSIDGTEEVNDKLRGLSG